MEQIDDDHVAFNAPHQAHYAFDTLVEEGSMNLDFSPLPEFEPLSESTANVPAPSRAEPAALNHGSRLSRRVLAMPERKLGVNNKPGTNIQRYTAKPHLKAKAVTQQFGQATARLRLFEERLSKIEQQNHTLVRRLAAYEKRISQVQLALQKAEEGHEEIAEMAKASIAFLKELNGDDAGTQSLEPDQF